MFGKLPLIEPAGPAEAYSYVKEAFAMSENYDTPVLLRMTTRVAHSKEDVEIGEGSNAPQSNSRWMSRSMSWCRVTPIVAISWSRSGRRRLRNWPRPQP